MNLSKTFIIVGYVNVDFPFAINRDKLYAVIRDLNVAADISHTIAQADLLITTQSQVKSNQRVKQLLKGHRIPVHVIKSNSQKCLQEFLREYFQLDQSDDAIHDDVINEINSICDRVIAEKRAFDAAPRIHISGACSMGLLLNEP